MASFGVTSERGTLRAVLQPSLPETVVIPSTIEQPVRNCPQKGCRQFSLRPINTKLHNKSDAHRQNERFFDEYPSPPGRSLPGSRFAICFTAYMSWSRQRSPLHSTTTTLSQTDRTDLSALSVDAADDLIKQKLESTLQTIPGLDGKRWIAHAVGVFIRRLARAAFVPL